MIIPTKFMKIYIEGLKIRDGVSFLEIKKFILFAGEKIFQGGFDGAEFVSAILHSYSPSPEGVVNGRWGVSLCKIRKILLFLEKKYSREFSMVLKPFLPV